MIFSSFGRAIRHSESVLLDRCTVRSACYGFGISDNHRNRTAKTVISDALQRNKAPIVPVLYPQQLIMTALLEDLAIGQEDNLVRMGNR